MFVVPTISFRLLYGLLILRHSGGAAHRRADAQVTSRSSENNMSDGRSATVPRPTRKSKRWTSFAAAPGRGRAIRTLQEEHNPAHRARVVHSQDTLLVQLSDENGPGWTVIAI